MSNLPRLLVVTPTLGVSPFLSASVASVRRQSLPIVHVIAAPMPQVEALSAKYPDCTVVADEGRFGGIYGALNRGLSQAPDDWDWFTYLNDDDLLLPAFSRAVEAHFWRDEPEPVLYGDVEIIDEIGRPGSRITVEKSPRWIGALLRQQISPLMQQGMIFRRDVVSYLRGFDTRYRLCADLDFWLRAYVSGHPFRYSGTTVAQFRIHAGQLSANTTRTEEEQADIVRRHLGNRIPAWTRAWARLRYRIENAPRYWERIRRRGFKRSYTLLQETPVR